MSRVQFVRQMLPRICKDFYELEFYHNPTGAATFDPQITTSVSTTVIWQTEAGVTVTTGTTHNFSYTPTAGAKICTVTVRGGLGLVTGIDCNNDYMTSIKNIEKCINLVDLRINANVSLDILISNLSKKLTYIKSDGCLLLRGDLRDFARTITTLAVDNHPLVTGSIIDAPRSPFFAIRRCPLLTGTLLDIPRNGTIVALDYAPLITGSTSDTPTTSGYMLFDGCLLVTPGTVSHAPGVYNVGFSNNYWDTTKLGVIIDDMYANRAVFTHAEPITLNLGGFNSRPSGGDVVSPLVTPGSGNTDADWEWNAGLGHHVPLSQQAKLYVLGNDPFTEGFKKWTITKNSVVMTVVAEGDSITAGGAGGVTGWPALLGTLLGPTVSVISVASGGDGIGVGNGVDLGMLIEASSQVDVRYHTLWPMIAVLEGGVNDISQGRTAQQVHDDTRTWCLARKVLGYDIILFSIPIRYGTTQAREDIRVAANALIVADYIDYADAYIDLDVSDAYVGYPFASGRNATYIQADNIHPTAAGEAVYRDLVNAAIGTL